MKSSLDKFQGRTALNENEIFKLKREAWQKNGDLSLNKYQIAALGKEENETIHAIGARIYGDIKC